MNISWFRSRKLLSFFIHAGLTGPGWQSSPPPLKVYIYRGKKGAFFHGNKHSTSFRRAVWKPTHTFVCTPLFCLIFTKLVEVFAFKMEGESEVLRALMSQSWKSYFHMSCHLTEVWVQEKQSLSHLVFRHLHEPSSFWVLLQKSAPWLLHTLTIRTLTVPFFLSPCNSKSINYEIGPTGTKNMYWAPEF